MKKLQKHEPAPTPYQQLMASTMSPKEKEIYLEEAFNALEKENADRENIVLAINTLRRNFQETMTEIETACQKYAVHPEWFMATNLINFVAGATRTVALLEKAESDLHHVDMRIAQMGMAHDERMKKLNGPLCELCYERRAKQGHDFCPDCIKEMGLGKKQKTTVNESNYYAAHGKRPSGFGRWGFQLSNGEVLWTSSKYGTAKKWALSVAAGKNLTVKEVLS